MMLRSVAIRTIRSTARVASRAGARAGSTAAARQVSSLMSRARQTGLAQGKLQAAVPARALSVASAHAEAPSVVSEGVVASVKYTGTFEDGTVFDTNTNEDGVPMDVAVGEGSMIPGFEAALVGMKVGDTKDITLSPEEGFGQPDPAGIVEVELSQLPEGVEVGSALQSQDGRRMIVASIDEAAGKATLDLNHPLAGKTINFSIELLACKAAPIVIHDVISEGDGKTYPKPGDMLTMHYTGTLTDGTQFDSSVEREAFEFQIGVGQVIQGWDKGVMKMSLGEKAVLKIPPELGYGAAGAAGVIPPNAELQFEVELLDIKSPPANGHGHSHGGVPCDGNH
eukprot:INCI3112.1.p2 GENE.INCI3112.1~~INCI3112.1.p2  ORF type:complete len:339 (+),score=67.33 INCI3112.1:156-1172(+)